jgi:hypothetical protein
MEPMMIYLILTRNESAERERHDIKRYQQSEKCELSRR